MKNLIIPPGQDTPGIHFEPNGNLSIHGISVPKNVHTFYKEVLDWMEGFQQEMPPEVKLELCLEYMNTSSLKTIVQLIINLREECAKNGSGLNIKWICDENDDELIEEGEMLQKCVDFPFQFVTIGSSDK